jgi:predicted O-methyltransferase YrrM
VNRPDHQSLEEQLVSVPTYLRTAAIPGWLPELDHDLLRCTLELQTALGVTGDVAELGVYMGRSATVIGAHVRPEETFYAVDLFDDLGFTDEANARENDESYAGLSRAAFEENYRRHHHHLPTVVQGPSVDIRDHAAPDSLRFVHIDASHLYEHVSADIAAARDLLGPQGLVVLDDYRQEHTPGVAAATWQAVGADLVPLVLSECKLYGTFDPDTDYAKHLREWAEASRYCTEVQRIGDHDVLRVWDGDRRIGARIRRQGLPRLGEAMGTLRSRADVARRRLRGHG